MTACWSFRGASGRRELTLDRAAVIGILNVTPDSFSDGGAYADAAAAADAARRMLDEGAAMIDIGGESTRPGALRVAADEQIRRVLPVIRALRESGCNAPLCVDTTLEEVALAALDAGADAINDVSAGEESSGGTFRVAAARGCGIILMHRRVPPESDAYSHAHARDPEYVGGVVAAVRDFLSRRAGAALEAGVDRAAIVLDPGLGFGKSVAQNYELLARARELASLGYPLLCAASRKSFIGAVTGEAEPRRRLAGSIAIAVMQFIRGVRLFRVHDVAAHVAALRTAAAALAQGPESGRE